MFSTCLILLSYNSLAQGSSALTHVNSIRVGWWADPSFTSPLTDTKHERSVIPLEISIYSLITPSCTRLHALNRTGCVNFMYFSFAYNYTSVMNIDCSYTDFVSGLLENLQGAYCDVKNSRSWPIDARRILTTRE